jgi:hypothetical protein
MLLDHWMWTFILTIKIPICSDFVLVRRRLGELDDFLENNDLVRSLNHFEGIYFLPKSATAVLNLAGVNHPGWVHLRSSSPRGGMQRTVWLLKSYLENG